MGKMLSGSLCYVIYDKLLLIVSEVSARKWLRMVKTIDSRSLSLSEMFIS